MVQYIIMLIFNDTVHVLLKNKHSKLQVAGSYMDELFRCRLSSQASIHITESVFILILKIFENKIKKNVMACVCAVERSRTGMR